MIDKELRRMRHLFEKESRTPESVQKQIDKSDTLVRADEIEVWKNFAATLLNRDETLANKIGLAMSIMSELNQGTTLSDIITSLSQDMTSTEAEKSWALKRGVEFCQAFEGQDALLNLNHHLKAIKDFAIANNLEFDYIPDIRLIPPEDTLKQFLDSQQEQLLQRGIDQSSVSPEIAQYRKEIAQYIYNRLNENPCLYVGQLDLHNSTLSTRNQTPIELQDIQPSSILHIQNAYDMHLATQDAHVRDYLMRVEQVVFNEQIGLVLDTGSEILTTMQGLSEELDEINPKWRHMVAQTPMFGYEHEELASPTTSQEEQNHNAPDPTDVF